MITVKQLEGCPEFRVLEKIPDKVRFEVDVREVASNGWSSSQLTLEITCPIVQNVLRPRSAKVTPIGVGDRHPPELWKPEHLENSIEGRLEVYQTELQSEALQVQAKATEVFVPDLTEFLELQEKAASAFLKAQDPQGDPIAHAGQYSQIVTEILLKQIYARSSSAPSDSAGSTGPTHG